LKGKGWQGDTSPRPLAEKKRVRPKRERPREKKKSGWPTAAEVRRKKKSDEENPAAQPKKG